MKNLIKHIISFIIAAIALIIGESNSETIRLDDTFNYPTTKLSSYSTDSQEIDLNSHLKTQALSWFTYRTYTSSKRVNNIHNCYKNHYSESIINLSTKKYFLNKHSKFYSQHSNSNHRLITLGRLII